MIGIGATLFKVPTAYGASAFSPASLFSNGEEGAWYDPSDLSTMFQNSDGTTAVAVGDPVGYIEDKSGNGNHAIQATSAKRPTLRQAGSLYYLEFDGAQGLRSAAIDFTSTDSMSVFAGAKSETDATQMIGELSTNSGGNDGTFRIGSVAGDQWRYASKGDGTLVNANANGYTPPLTSVLTGLSDISDPVVTTRVDGVQEASSTTSQGSGNYGNHVLNVGARNNGGGFQLNGFIYGLIVRGATSSADEIASAEAYIAGKTGVSL